MNRRQFFNRLSSLLAAFPVAAFSYPWPATKPALPLLTTQVASFQYYQGKQIWRLLQIHNSLSLKRQPDNRHDYRAVEVYWQNHKLGYVPRSDNAVIAQMLDNGAMLQARIIRIEEDDASWKGVRFTIFAKL